MNKGVKIFAAFGCATVMIPCLLGVFTTIYESARGFPELEKKAKLRLQAQADTRDKIRSRLNELQSWFNENGLGEDVKPSKRVKESETFFVDASRFAAYFSVLDGNSNFSLGQEREKNSLDSRIKTLIDKKLVFDLGNSEFAEHQNRVTIVEVCCLV